jgi:short-subunit dehydrogenase
MRGLITVPFAAVYCATKHALEALAEGLKAELAGTGVEVCTANPGVYGTGFNDRGAETMMRWPTKCRLRRCARLPPRSPSPPISGPAPRGT